MQCLPLPLLHRIICPLNQVLQSQVNNLPKVLLAAALDIAWLTRPLQQDLVSRLTCSAVGLPSPVGPVVQGFSL